MPAAISPEKAPEMRDPEYNRAVRNASSFLVYQQDRKKRHPGLEILATLACIVGDTYKVGSLDETKTEPDGDDSLVRMSRGNGTRYNTPDDHDCRQIDGGLAELAEDQVGWHLHDNIADEEDANACLRGTSQYRRLRTSGW